MITKNNSITKFIAAGIFVLGLTFSAFAQQSDNDDILAKAEVLTAIDVTGVTDLNFGYVNPGVDKTVAVDGTITPSTSNSANVTVGYFTVDAGADANVTMSYTTLPTNLVHTNTVDLLPITNYTTVWNSTADPTTGTSWTAVGAGVTLTNFPVGGTVHVYLGGTVQPANNQLAGVYASPVVLTAVYN